jgi:hypothetical protein
MKIVVIFRSMLLLITAITFAGTVWAEDTASLAGGHCRACFSGDTRNLDCSIAGTEGVKKGDWKSFLCTNAYSSYNCNVDKTALITPSDTLIPCPAGLDASAITTFLGGSCSAKNENGGTCSVTCREGQTASCQNASGTNPPSCKCV